MDLELSTLFAAVVPLVGACLGYFASQQQVRVESRKISEESKAEREALRRVAYGRVVEEFVGHVRHRPYEYEDFTDEHDDSYWRFRHAIFQAQLVAGSPECLHALRALTESASGVADPFSFEKESEALDLFTESVLAELRESGDE